jgi:hypothetical protein
MASLEVLLETGAAQQSGETAVLSVLPKVALENFGSD